MRLKRLHLNHALLPNPLLTWDCGRGIQKRNLEICKKYCPAVSQSDRDRAFHALAQAVKTFGEKRLSDCCETVRSLKPVSIVSLEIPKKRERHDDDAVRNHEEEKDTGSTPATKKNKSISAKPPSKRARNDSEKLKKCCVRGCKNAHFWWKNGFFAHHAKNTSALITLKSFIIITAKIFLF